MIDLSISFGGFKQAEKMLNDLPMKARKRVIKQSLRRAAMVVQKQAKSLAPVGATGNLRRSLKVRTGKGLVSQAYAASGTGEKNDGWYAHFLERGTSRGIKRHSFLEQAGSNSNARMVTEFIKRFVQLMLKELR